METLHAIFTEKIVRTPTTTSFRFSPEKPLVFLPGQFVRVIFNEQVVSDQSMNKCLSLSASPRKPWIEVTKRLTESAFSQRLNGLQQGESVLLQGPMGSCVFREEYTRICFLVGGIGITPVMSMLEYLPEKKSPVSLTLFYSNRNEEDIAFQNELTILQRGNPFLTIIYTITDCRPKTAHYEYGPITPSMLTRHLSDPSGYVFFIFGPPKMVSAMKTVCGEIGCQSLALKTETFTGYE